MKSKTVFAALAAVAVLATGVTTGLWMRGYTLKEAMEMGVCAMRSRAVKRTVAEVVADIEARKPHLKALADGSGGRMRLVALKRERRVEVSAPGWAAPRIYPMTAFSGRLGPKLREGDGQIPEGIYGVEYLNPNSRFYLSLKVSYPNAFDRARAREDGRANLGGDIMIHGKAATIGCIPVGDDAIEDVFYLAAQVGIKNVEIVIAPYDMRQGRQAELEASPLAWYPQLCDALATALSRGGGGRSDR